MSPSHYPTVAHTHCEFNAILCARGLAGLTKMAPTIVFDGCTDGLLPPDPPLTDAILPETTHFDVHHYNGNHIDIRNEQYAKTRRSSEILSTPDCIAVCPGDPANDDYDLSTPPITVL
ncbi:hypothetical protein N7535_007540 [Penicillium sp. DV-2018c]|nr:hypothetical protein N7461_003565 [Penicillium sp. DV-2018c]KAJ5565902.1 hypothetical protein N7535_007540 [Penicillium sp. DV-2018c]